MKILKNKYLLSVLIVFFISCATFALALEQEYPTIKGETIKASMSLPQLINYFFNFSLMVGGVIAMTIITIAGFRWMSSAANPNEKQEAIQQIKSGAIGLLIVLGSFLFLSTINPELVKLPELKLKDVIKPTSPMKTLNFLNNNFVPNNELKKSLLKEGKSFCLTTPPTVV